MATADDDTSGVVPLVAIVIPVYQGEHSLPALVDEIADLKDTWARSPTTEFHLQELILVNDSGPDDSQTVLEELAAEHDWITVVWLTRNFGQHPATVAGIAASSADWIVTMDEDGLHDPALIPALFRRAVADGADLVYAQPTEPRAHPWYRNATSRVANRAFGFLAGGSGDASFSSFRLMDGPISRSLAAYCGHGVYLDVALTWVMSDIVQQPVQYRAETRSSSQSSGYGLRGLLSHFRRLVVTSGTRPLRIIAALGFASTLVGLALAVTVVILRLLGTTEAEGWASVMITVLVFSGVIMMALGIIAEYLSVAVTMATGRPMYLTMNRPPRRPQSQHE